jgi:hypothetical protein
LDKSPATIRFGIQGFDGLISNSWAVFIHIKRSDPDRSLGPVPKGLIAIALPV